MTSEVAATEARATLERVRRFHFDRFTPDSEEWTSYIQRFENELAMHGLLEGPDTEVHRQNLLLSCVDPEALRYWWTTSGLKL